MSEPLVMVGISGGVDSAVAALLLQQGGYRVEGLFMKNWDDDDGTEYCTAARDLLDADHLCRQLGIELHTVSFAGTYRDAVFTDFLHEYERGRTPNPDILCNREIKFSVFRAHARELGADLIATGHYARLRPTDTGMALLRGIDEGKDQSYFLQAVPPAALCDVLFPLGEYHKTEVRQLAAEAGLAVAAKRDSTGICFIGERRFREFLSRYLSCGSGPVRTLEGRTVGTHSGTAYYTIGQRQGLGIGGGISADNQPWYVAHKDPHNNTLTVVAGGQHPALFAHWLAMTEPNWISSPPPPPFTCLAQIRHRQRATQVTVSRRADGDWLVRFDTPQRAVAAGQHVALYQADHCLGGGVIDHCGPPLPLRSGPACPPHAAAVGMP